MHPLTEPELEVMTTAFNLDAAHQDHKLKVSHHNEAMAIQLDRALKTILNDLRWQQDLHNQVRDAGTGTVNLKIPHLEGIGYERSSLDEVKSKFRQALEERFSKDIIIDFDGPMSFMDHWKKRGNISIRYRGPRVTGAAGGWSTGTTTSITQAPPVRQYLGEGSTVGIPGKVEDL